MTTTPAHCPLCGEELFGAFPGAKDKMCPTKVYYGTKTYMYHYQWHELNKLSVWFVPPYEVAILGNLSTIYVLDTSVTYTEWSLPVFKPALYLHEALDPQSPDKLLKRLKTLITFS